MQPVGTRKLQKEMTAVGAYSVAVNVLRKETVRISPLKSNGQALKQECCLLGVLGDHCDPPDNFLP